MKTYTVTVPAYGKQPGESVDLDPNDTMVALNVTAGVLVEGKDATTVAPTMTCPLCRDDLDMKRPPKLSSDQELQAHYQDKHAGFATPAWQPDTEE